MENCKCENAYFVGAFGEEYCPDCKQWNNLEPEPKGLRDLGKEYPSVIF